MTNEILKAGDVERDLDFESWYVQNYHDGDIHPNKDELIIRDDGEYSNRKVQELSEVWLSAIKSQQSRIDLLESAIREFNKDQLAQENYAGDDDRYHEQLVNKEYQSILNLRNLMENEK
jgi:hypothetical protein